MACLLWLGHDTRDKPPFHAKVASYDSSSDLIVQFLPRAVKKSAKSLAGSTVVPTAYDISPVVSRTTPPQAALAFLGPSERNVTTARRYAGPKSDALLGQEQRYIVTMSLFFVCWVRFPSVCCLVGLILLFSSTPDLLGPGL